MTKLKIAYASFILGNLTLAFTAADALARSSWGHVM